MIRKQQPTPTATAIGLDTQSNITMPYGSLTQRQREIANLVVTGASNKEIARELSISIKTVKNTLTLVFEKTGARSRTELAVNLVHASYQSA